MPDVSVIIPTYNRAPLIGATLESVLAQSQPPAEVLVVDDGSTDDTAAVVSQFPAVRYYRIANSGVCAARNVGVSLTRSRWIAFCDSDDLWRPDRLEAQFKLLARAPEVEYSFTNWVAVRDDAWDTVTKFDQGPADFWAGLPLRAMDADGLVVDGPLDEKILRYQPIFPSTLLMTRDFFQRVGGFVESLGRVLSEDLEFTLRCVQEGPAAVVLKPVVGIRKHAGNFSGNLLRTLLGEIRILRYVQAHHVAACRYAQTLTDEITRRSRDALEVAFDEGDLALVRRLRKAIPRSQRGLKLKLKVLTARMPEVLGSRLCRLMCDYRSARSGAAAGRQTPAPEMLRL